MKYMIRKPEYIKDAAVSRFFPNTPVVLLITLAIFAAFFLVSLIVGVIYAVSAVRGMSLENLSQLLASQGAVLFSLYYEAVLIAMALIYVRLIERRPPRSIGLARQRFFVRYAAGFGIGFVLLALYSVLPLLFADVSYTGVTWLVPLYLGAFIVQSAAEEILFRGYMMSALMRRGGAMQAVLWSTVLFALSHIPGSSISIGDLLQIFLLGAVLALLVLRTGSLWGAMGLHAAWNFLTGCLSPIELGPYRIGYSVLSVPATLEQGVFDYIIAFVVFITAIALLLFAGRGRLVILRTEQQTIFDNAVKIMRSASRGYGEFRSYALRVAEIAEGKSKAAALLHYAVRCGCSADMVRFYAPPDITAAVDALMPRPTDQGSDYMDRVAGDPIAAGVKAAEARLEQAYSARRARQERAESAGKARRDGLNDY